MPVQLRGAAHVITMGGLAIPHFALVVRVGEGENEMHRTRSEAQELRWPFEEKGRRSEEGT